MFSLYCFFQINRAIASRRKMLSSSQDIKEVVLTGVNIGDFGKGEFGAKKHDHTFFDLVSTLDEVSCGLALVTTLMLFREDALMALPCIVEYNNICVVFAYVIFIIR